METPDQLPNGAVKPSARDVVVRAALGTGSGIRVQRDTDSPADGVGALLRRTTG